MNNYKYQFTNCGATGRLGPTQSQCDASYNGTNVNVTINTQEFKNGQFQFQEL